MNYFEQIADNQMAAPSKARHLAAEKRAAASIATSERDAPMVASPADRAMFEATKQFREYLRHLKERKRALLSGPYSAELAELMQMLKCLSPETAGSLVDFVEHADWLQQADYNTRHDALAVIASAISDYRVSEGLAPFDDSLPGEVPTAFEQIRFILTGVGAWAA